MYRLMFCLLLLFAVAGCREADPVDEITDVTPVASPVPTDTPVPPTETPLPTATETPQPAATQTPSPTVTNTPSPTPRPSRTPTPQPTATPENYYRSVPGGFEALLPSDWTVLESDPSGFLTAVDSTGSTFVMIAGSYEDEESAFPDVVTDFEQVLEADWETAFTVESQGVTVPIGDGVSAKRATLVSPEAGVEVQLFYTHRETRGYVIMVLSETPPDERMLTTLFESISFFSQELYGLERDKTMVLLGSDPIPENLDPALQAGSAAGYVGLLYRGLVKLRPDLSVSGDLAESWAISADGTVYTFTLRSDAAFSDGTPLTAADVKRSWERAADPETDSQTAGTYLGDIVGVDEKLAGDATEITGVRVADTHTLVVEVEAPTPYFLAKLTYPTSYVVDIADIEAGGEEWMYAPNASGPYRVYQYHPEESIVFERNAAYYAPPEIPYVLYRFDQFGLPLSRFEAGEIDMAGVYGENLALIQEPDHALHDYWLSTVNLCTTMLQFDNQKPPMDDPDVRRAFALAIDRDALHERLGENSLLLADTLLPPGLPGYRLPEGNDLAYDASAAQAALEAATGGDELAPVTLSTLGRGYGDDPFNNALIEMWRDVLGVEVTLEYLDPDDYTEAARQREGHIVSWGWCADYPDPENFLDILFHSQSDFNLTAYTNPEVDALLEQARTEQDSARRLELYQEAERLLLQDVAVHPISHPLGSTVIHPRIEGYQLAPMGVSIIPELSIDPDVPLQP